MLVVNIELWPGGNPMGRKPIAFIALANTSDLADTSNYSGQAWTAAAPHLGIAEQTKQFTVENHQRKAPVWGLLEKALQKLSKN